jgi:hypothetical protein
VEHAGCMTEMRSAYILVRKPEGKDHLDLKDHFFIIIKSKVIPVIGHGGP